MRYVIINTGDEMKKIILLFLLIPALCGCAVQSVTLPAQPRYSPGEEMHIVYPQLEYGYSSLVKTPEGKNILIGCGSKKDFPKLYELLRSRDVISIDVVIIASDNEENLGGLQNLLSNFEVSEVYVSDGIKNLDNIRNLCLANSAKVTELYMVAEGTRIYEEDYISLDVLSSRMCDTPNGKKSAMSMYLVYKDNAVFFEGDGDFVAERNIIATMGDDIQADIISVPHSATAYLPSKELLDKVKPKYAVLPVYNGNYPMMHLEKLLREKGIEAIRTDTEGDVIFLMDGVNIKYHIQKETVQ